MRPSLDVDRGVSAAPTAMGLNSIRVRAPPQPRASRIQTPQPKPQPVPGGQPDGSDGSLTRGCLGPTDAMANPHQPTRWGLIASFEGRIEVLAAAAEEAKLTLRLTGVLVCTGYDGDARRDHLSDQTQQRW